MGRVTLASLYPGNAADDVIAFQLPVGSAKYLRLELPAGAIGAGFDDKFRFQIPARMVAR